MKTIKGRDLFINIIRWGDTNRVSHQLSARTQPEELEYEHTEGEITEEELVQCISAVDTVREVLIQKHHAIQIHTKKEIAKLIEPSK